jgi:DUF917 family protein
LLCCPQCLGSLIAKRALRSGKPIRIVSPASLAKTAFAIPVGFMGAPTVFLGSSIVDLPSFRCVANCCFLLAEKIPHGDETVRALRAVEQAAGCRADAVLCAGIC